ncbi:alpha/beta hydrolase family esterase [Aquihabitans sp. McL0605]|uniref:alpha/beta hydrolase family esterase n=1 Tax=Aquihabitans sp. McL0605 TaxID=3415671 RepID=UPI003CF7CEF3
MIRTTRANPTGGALRRRRVALVASVAVAGSLVLAACGGSSSDGADATKASTTTTAAPVTAAPAGHEATGPAVPSKGCGAGAGSTSELTLDKQFVDDSDRWFLVTTPGATAADEPLPLVLDFHGLAEGADIHAKLSDLAPFAQAHGFILVSPNGTGSPVRWQVDPDMATNPDLQYTSDVLDQVEAEHCVDTSRVYATGLSNGAFMSSTLACAMSDRIAAVAPVSGLTHPDGCAPTRPVPILAFHGTADPILLFNGGIGDKLGHVLGTADGSPDAPLPEADLNGKGYPATAQAWATDNGCTGRPDDTDLTKTVVKRTWDCPADGTTEFVIVKGGGHSWPGSAFSQKIVNAVGPTDMSVVADQLIWSFFQRFQLPAT